MEIINEKPVSINEIKVYVDSIKKREKELNFRAKKVEEYLNNVAKLKKAPDFRKNLEGLDISRLREKSIVHIMNICPKESDSLKSVLSSENLTLKEDDLKKILDVVNKYA
jgi:DNA-directed RNA polymerase subunit F